jgi:hypothetical protein
MESNRFDRLVVALSTADTRRGVVRLLGTLPFVGGLATLLGEDETFADGRRRRHKKPHKHQKRTGNRAGKQKKRTGKKKHPDKGCKAESHAATCDGQCGTVKNNCKKAVDCGSCACDPPCEICQTCQGEPGECLQDAPGTPCGDPGQVCQGDGSCACEATSCPRCTTCGGDGACEGCAGCCDANGVCNNGTTDTACGSNGACDECTGQKQCQNRQCVCVPDCDGKMCGPDGCGDHCGSGCPPNATCTNDGTAGVCDFRKCDDTCCGQANAICHASTGDCCVAESVEQICNGQCGDFVNNCGISVDCGSCTCSPACPICQTCDTGNGECVNVSNSEPCGDGLQCKNGQCVCDGASCPDGCCQGEQCHIDDDAACGAGGGICGGCVDQGAATCGTTGTCRGGDCELYTSGATCQAATCTGETMLQPACTCDGQGSCNCPGSITCPNDLVCRNGACLTTCGNDNDCDVGTCAPDGTCMPPFICDCSNLNDCSGHGVCTETCTCLCDDGWSGFACTDQPMTLCGDYPTCDTCRTHLMEGCTWCLETIDGEIGLCTRSVVCIEPVEMCVCDSTSCPNGCCDAQGQCQVNTADVCGSGGVTCVTCNQCGDFCDEGICQGGSCDCAVLDGCSGHGCCTDTCACVCVAPWTGANCSELPQPTCADFETCEECSAHATDLGCVRCSDTFDGEFTACVAAIECSFAVESCQ